MYWAFNKYICQVMWKPAFNEIKWDKNSDLTCILANIAEQMLEFFCSHHIQFLSYMYMHLHQHSVDKKNTIERKWCQNDLFQVDIMLKNVHVKVFISNLISITLNLLFINMYILNLFDINRIFNILSKKISNDFYKRTPEIALMITIATIIESGETNLLEFFSPLCIQRYVIKIVPLLENIEKLVIS